MRVLSRNKRIHQSVEVSLSRRLTLNFAGSPFVAESLHFLRILLTPPGVGTTLPATAHGSVAGVNLKRIFNTEYLHELFGQSSVLRFPHAILLRFG